MIPNADEHIDYYVEVAKEPGTKKMDINYRIIKIYVHNKQVLVEMVDKDYGYKTVELCQVALTGRHKNE